VRRDRGCCRKIELRRRRSIASLRSVGIVLLPVETTGSRLVEATSTTVAAKPSPPSALAPSTSTKATSTSIDCGWWWRRMTLAPFLRLVSFRQNVGHVVRSLQGSVAFITTLCDVVIVHFQRATAIAVVIGIMAVMFTTPSTLGASCKLRATAASSSVS